MSAADPSSRAAAAPIRVLIVDDDPEIRLIAGHLLRAAGHFVAEAEDGAAAADALDRHRPDILLMDLMLGAEDGVETAAALLRGSAARPRLIFLTGATQPAQRARMDAAGAAGILEKPFDPATFVAHFESLAGGPE
jgi:CheY-like chemotaxis protein